MDNPIPLELQQLMQHFAEFGKALFQRNDCSHTDEWDEVNRRLRDEYNIFAQVRMAQSAVFYADQRAWSENLGPFAEIPFSEVEDIMPDLGV